MRSTHALVLTVLVGAAIGSTPLAAQSSPIPVAPPVQTSDTSWPVIVPRLATYSSDQKAALTKLVTEYCTRSAAPKRAELQARIRAVLTPRQALEAARYWIPEDLKYDMPMVRQYQQELVAGTGPVATIDAGRPVDVCGRGDGRTQPTW